MAKEIETSKIFNQIEDLLKELDEANILKMLEAYITPHGIIIPRRQLTKKEIIALIEKHVQ